ncbi:cytochrome P450 [Mrakia frigida]|uniref:cytochrome P450 n=1 Tax=Mrakia frigida TaxID=29902 RepID=UPI003FCBF4ED
MRIEPFSLNLDLVPPLDSRRMSSLLLGLFSQLSFQAGFTLTLLGGVLLLSLFFLHPFYSDPFNLRSIPGPPAARILDLWLAGATMAGVRSLRVHRAHARYGPIVRIAPNHVSIADPEAIPIVLGHGTGFLKAEFYDAFVSIRRGVFNTRDRTEHTRKRKLVSHVFSQKNVLSFTSYIHTSIDLLVAQWDRILASSSSPKPTTTTTTIAEFDTLPWFNFLAFDIIGSLAFGRPFGMLRTGKDAAPVEAGGTVEAIRVLNERGEVSATLGCLEGWVRPYVKKLPWFKKRLISVSDLASIAIAAVSHRLANPPSSDPSDLLSKLQRGKDENGEEMGTEELTAEALTQLIAGSDTTSNSSCAIFYHLAFNPQVLSTLHAELDLALAHLDPYEAGSPKYDDVKALPYLEAVIGEALRIHCTSGIGLPRLVPPEGAMVAGRFWVGGTVLSVPTYTLHRLKSAWGEDPDVFRPERWFQQDKDKMAAAFMPFSFGPRGCVGRNLASMELLLIVSSLAWRFDFTTSIPEQKLEVKEGFLRKPTECVLRVRRRSERVE